MTSQCSPRELELSIDRFLNQHSAKRVALAAFVAGGASIFTSLIVYNFTLNGVFSSIAFGISSLILINLCMITIVPPTEMLAQSRKTLTSAVKDPKRIRSIEKHKVRILDQEGKSRSLNRIEQEIWESIVVPALIRNRNDSSTGDQFQNEVPKPGELTRSERRYIEEQRHLVGKKEKSILEKQKHISEEQRRIEEERKELEERSKSLQNAENMVIDRLSEVETVQAELEQMQENLEIEKTAFGRNREALENPMFEPDREATMKAKEAELEKLKQQLAEDRHEVEMQKSEFEGLKSELMQSTESGELLIEILGSKTPRELELEARLRGLEEDHRELKERTKYIEEAENTLISRLQELTEREASIEQSEINAGLRQD